MRHYGPSVVRSVRPAHSDAIGPCKLRWRLDLVDVSALSRSKKDRECAELWRLVIERAIWLICFWPVDS